jgi:hypothetical protein
MVAMEIMILPTWAYRRSGQEGWDREVEEQFQIERHLMLGHTLLLRRQKCLEKSIRLMANSDAILKIKRLMRPKVLYRRNVGQAHVE